MSNFCLILHDLEPPGDSATAVVRGAWALAAELGRQGSGATIVHTGKVADRLRDSLTSAAEACGASYRHLDQLAPPGGRRVFPAVESHRLALRVLQALAALKPGTVVFFGHPAHASAMVAARRCGLALTDCPIGTVLETTEEYRRDQEQVFPAEGRESIATDFLERQAVAGADVLVCATDTLRAWLGAASWKLPKTTAVEGIDGERAGERILKALKSGQSGESTNKGTVRPSVCVAHYEHAKYLGEALASLAAQETAPHEVIVVDDGSKSPEAQAVFAAAEARYRARGWKFLRQENTGPAIARQRAAKEASGDALIFCDADNLFHPDMVGVLSRALAASGADCVTCGFEAFSDSGDLGTAGVGYVFAPLGPCLELGLVENVLGDTNFIVRRDTFLESGGFPTDNRAASEDWQFLLQLLLKNRSIEAVPAVLFDYRLASFSHARRHTELASAQAATAPAQAGVPRAWKHLWLHLAGLVRDMRLPRLEEALAAAHTQYAQAEQAWQLRDRIRRSGIFLLEHSQQTLDIQLRTTREDAAAQSRRDAHAIEQLSRRVTELERDWSHHTDKIRRMQESFSWRSTAWLRALRRAWHNRKKTVGASAAAPVSSPNPASWERFRYHLDAPRNWSRRDGPVAIRGWCFSEEPAPLKGIRARIGGRIYEGKYGGERPDLLRAHPDCPQCCTSGFKIEVLLLPDDQTATLEARGEDGQWRAFYERALGPADAAEAGSYEHWVQTHDTLTPSGMEALKSAARAIPGPKISILMPVFNPAEKWLARAIESVQEQAYLHWELCIADDASTEPGIRTLLEGRAYEDPRIKVVFREKNGHISAATNSALALATGEYAALFDHDDELAPHALYCVAKEIAAYPGAELIYTDEDKIDEQGFRFDPHFKPDWNPDLLRGQNYISHLCVFRTGILRAVGGLREGLEGSQDWDLVLRVVDRIQPTTIRHIPRVLYHWRANEGSTALHLGEKNYAAEAARRTLAEDFARRSVPSPLSQTVGGHWRASYPLPPRPPLVSIIIPTHNAAPLLRVCVTSIIARTHYVPYEIILVNNRSDDPAALALFAELASEDGVRVLDYDLPFNYSAINNFAAKHARGEVLCLLNNDIEVLGTSWLDELVSHALRSEIGAVGARLYYPDLRVQHAGVVTGIGGVAGHVFKGFLRQDPGTPQFRPHLAQNISVVTAACLAIRRAVFFEAGGFDEENLPVAFNDVDFCLKVEALGYRNLYTPFAELLHHESASRGQEDTPEKVRRFQSEIAAVRERWGGRLQNDPAYNPNLSLDSEDFALAYPPRLPPLV